MFSKIASALVIAIAQAADTKCKVDIDSWSGQYFANYNLNRQDKPVDYCTAARIGPNKLKSFCTESGVNFWGFNGTEVTHLGKDKEGNKAMVNGCKLTPAGHI